MKKLLVLVGILAAFSLMGCPKDPKDPVNPPASDPIENPSEPETPAAPVVITYTDDITIADNHNQYGDNFQVNIDCLKDIQLKAGEKVKVEFKADITREKVVNTIKGNFVDTSAAANYWTVLNDPTDVVILDGEGDKINFTGIFEITKDATAKGANYFVIFTDGAAEDGEPKLSNVELKLTIGTQLPEEDGDEGDKEPEAPTEIVLFEGDFSNYSVITTKTVLSENAGKTLALSIRNDSGEGREGWGIGNIEFATDATNVYGSKTTAAIELKPTTFTDNICILEFPVDDVLAAADAELVTANVYNGCVLVKAVIK